METHGYNYAINAAALGWALNLIALALNWGDAWGVLPVALSFAASYFLESFRAAGWSTQTRMLALYRFAAAMTVLAYGHWFIRAIGVI